MRHKLYDSHFLKNHNRHSFKTLSMLFLAILAALPFLASAKTDLVGCTSSISGPSLVWYVPDTGELCDFLDCGGGRELLSRKALC